MRRGALLLVLLLPVASLSARGIHWLESEAHRDFGPKPGPAFHGTPSPLVPRDEPTITRDVYGYDPYWTSDQYLHYDLLTHIGIFDVTLEPDGSISNPHNFPNAWVATIDRAHRNGVKCEMVATCFGGSNITQAIRAANSIPNLVSLASSAGMDGINMDFEGIYGSDRDTMVRFMRDLSAACRAEGLELTMATMPLDFSNAYDFAALAETTDGLFIMGYNYHWQGGPEAGPVAPLFGWPFYGNLQMMLDDYLAEIGSGDKLFFGLPYYGFEWPTHAETTHSSTAGYGTALTYSQGWANARQRGRLWDDEGKVPWYRYNNGGWNQGWYDDDTSLVLKYREVHEHDMLGTGMWALGYDGSRRELWAALRESFNLSLAGFTNGDCEDWRLDTLPVPSDTTENPVGWYEGHKAQYRREDSHVHGGSHSIRHIPDSLGFDWPVVSKLFQDVEVLPGTAYQFSAWARKNDGLGNRMKLVLEWFDAQHEVISRSNSPVLEDDSIGWVELSTGQQTAPSGAEFARLCLWVEGHGGHDHWDDIMFSPVTGVEESAEGGGMRAELRIPTVMRAPDLAQVEGRVFDMTGREVTEQALHLKPGVYFVMLQGASARKVLIAE